MIDRPIHPDAQVVLDKTSVTIDHNRVIEYANKIMEYEEKYWARFDPQYTKIPCADVITKSSIHLAVSFIKKDSKRPCYLCNILPSSTNTPYIFAYLDALEIFDCISPEYRELVEKCQKMWQTLLPETKATVEKYLYAGHENILHKSAKYFNDNKLGIVSVRKIHSILKTITDARDLNSKYRTNEQQPKICWLLERRKRNYRQRVRRAIEKCNSNKEIQ
jgi:hypothetical protein